MADENQGGFKVTDRRLFNPDGTPRDDVQKEEEPTAPEQPTQLRNQVDHQEPGLAPEPLQSPGSRESEEQELPEQTMFTEFLMSIATSAFIYLGLMEHPATGKRHVDLNAARESIDMLTMLQDKTKGNLTAGEAKFFKELLADLRMQFVSMNK